MKAWLFAAAAMALATSALIPTARADQAIPARQMYAPPPQGAPSYAPTTAYTPPPAPAQGVWGTESTTPAKIGSPKQP